MGRSTRPGSIEHGADCKSIEEELRLFEEEVDNAPEALSVESPRKLARAADDVQTSLSKCYLSVDKATERC